MSPLFNFLHQNSHFLVIFCPKNLTSNNPPWKILHPLGVCYEQYNIYPLPEPTKILMNCYLNSIDSKSPHTRKENRMHWKYKISDL